MIGDELEALVTSKPGEVIMRSMLAVAVLVSIVAGCVADAAPGRQGIPSSRLVLRSSQLLGVAFDASGNPGTGDGAQGGDEVNLILGSGSR